MKIIVEDEKYMPFYATAGAAGMDLKARIPELDATIHPGRSLIVSTGVRFLLDPGTEGQVRGRSGLNFHSGVVTGNVGTIDEDYTGTVMVKLYNMGENPVVIHDGERVAQIVFAKVYRPNVEVVDNFEVTTARGESGFGSTGK